jgi:hypothetical protein
MTRLRSKQEGAAAIKAGVLAAASIMDDSLFIDTIEIDHCSGFKLPTPYPRYDRTMQPLIRTRLLLLAAFAAASTPSSSETPGDDGRQVRT